MTKTPGFTMVATVIGTPDPPGLARFYSALLGWEIKYEEPDWVMLKAPEGAGLSFQLEENHVPPTWPADTDDQQMMMHLDIWVDDLDAAGERAMSLGAVLAEYQPQEEVRVYLDPAGHPFCLFEN
ncbi:MAG TPA: VOC family protein [Acidimicrobiia bacterium]|nr:VOC family protein [Acidimicrobiia bacterium]